MSELDTLAQETLERGSTSRFHTLVAILVALTATLMALCMVKDSNIVQAMSQAQVRAADAWAYYQAASIKRHLAESQRDQLHLQLALGSLAGDAKRLLEAALGQAQAQITQYQREQVDLKATATGYEQDYDRLNRHDDQFDMAESGFSLAMALYGMAALTRQRWLLGVAIAFSGSGILLGLSCFLGWSLHPDWLATLLS